MKKQTQHILLTVLTPILIALGVLHVKVWPSQSKATIKSKRKWPQLFKKSKSHSLYSYR